jgi:predicted transcriptional regulator
MNSPKSRPRSDYLPGIAVRDGFVFMNGEPVATLTKAEYARHAVQDFKDFVFTLNAAGIQATADAAEYERLVEVEAELEDSKLALKDAEQLESELNDLIGDLIGDLRMELEVINRLNDELEAKIAELQDRAREDA